MTRTYIFYVSYKDADDERVLVPGESILEAMDYVLSSRSTTMRYPPITRIYFMGIEEDDYTWANVKGGTA